MALTDIITDNNQLASLTNMAAVLEPIYKFILCVRPCKVAKST